MKVNVFEQALRPERIEWRQAKIGRQTHRQEVGLQPFVASSGAMCTRARSASMPSAGTGRCPLGHARRTAPQIKARTNAEPAMSSATPPLGTDELLTFA